MTDTVNESSGNVFSDLGVTITLDEVAKRTDAVCTEYVDDMKRVKASFEEKFAAIAAAIDASPDLDKDATASIVLGRIKKMIGDAAAVLG
ncbi:hypothetical protein [Ensifer aridi]|uniref:hypothetical protein n=1 Tax=Ensifer aridi TaxID=1708715 RepID=UPI000A111AA8|nr:hypothetical protein [Ensifer aridi]